MATTTKKINSGTTPGADTKEVGNVAGGGSAIDPSKTRGGVTSPEGVLMLCIAIFVDGIGFIIFAVGTWFGIDDYGILDILGMLVFGGWVFLRSGHMNTDVAKKGLKRFIKSFVVELIPFLGGASPTWTWLVYKTLKEGDK